jgi:hypothetical protein
MDCRQQKRILNQEELENRILHGLSCEWERALWILNPSYREKMRPPLFSLRDMNDRWGTWRGQKREICLSRTLVLNHSWGSVREVLLHEMAHQLAEEVLGAWNEPPHGSLFLKACHLLRANPRASGNYKTLDERISQETSSSEDRILLRVKKLMALAESPNQYEAEAAMTKTHDLIAKYNLDLLGREAKRDFISVFVGRPGLRHFAEDYFLAHLLQDFYFVQGIWVSSYVPEKRKTGRVLEINGTIPNVKMASYVHDFVKRFIHSQWVEYNKDKGLNRYRLTDFAVGIIEGFRSRLELQLGKKGPAGNSLALMKMQDPLLKEYLAYRYPHTAMVKTGAGRQDGIVLKDGKKIGKNLVISKGIMGRTGNRGLQLVA